MKNLKNLLNVFVLILLASTLYNCSNDDTFVSTEAVTEEVYFRINTTNDNYEDILADAGFALSTKKASDTNESVAWIAIEVTNAFDIAALQATLETTTGTSLGIHLESEDAKVSRYMLEFSVEAYASLYASLEAAYKAKAILAAAYPIVFSIEMLETSTTIDEAQLIADIQFATGREVLFLHTVEVAEGKTAASRVKAVTKAECCVGELEGENG